MSLGFHKGNLISLILIGSQILIGQTVSNTVRGNTVTTGIVGVASTQTARLNVLNLQPVIPGVAAVACPATLEFYDESGALLKQLVLSNISPANSVSLVFKPPVATATANARAQIRAVVFTPSTAATNSGQPTTMPMIAVNAGCSVMPSLEIVDDLTGVTHSFTTDLRPMPGYRLLTPAGAVR